MHATECGGPLDRRGFLRLSTASLLAATGVRRVCANDGTEVQPIDDRIRTLAAQAPLSMRFEGSTADECRRWQAAFADKLRMLLGPHRPPTRWESVLERTVDCDDHVREERLLTAERVAPLPLHLLLPRRKPLEAPASLGPNRHKLPAVLAIHGHGRFGYDAVVGRDDTQELRDEIARNHYDYARQLVLRGYVVAAPCLTPFGRRQGGATRKGPGIDACAMTFISMQLLGKLLIAENLRDILWSLEYLCSHDAVDPRRIGCVGLSYGGRMTMLAAALEPRIRVAVISGALNCLQERVATGHGAGCQVIPGLLAYGDVPEIASLIAPRPCLWEVGSHDDLISPAWADTALARIGRAYRSFGADDQLRVDRFDGAHEWHGTHAYPLLHDVLKS